MKSPNESLFLDGQLNFFKVDLWFWLKYFSFVDPVAEMEIFSWEFHKIFEKQVKYAFIVITRIALSLGGVLNPQFILDVHPPLGLIFFIFMQFVGNFGQIISSYPGSTPQRW